MTMLPPLRRSTAAIKAHNRHSNCAATPTTVSGKTSNNAMFADRRRFKQQSTLLPRQAQELKDTIATAHPLKLVRFSLSRMKYVATPPVAIPEMVANPRAVSTMVAGKKVAFTMGMWRNSKKKRAKRRRQLDLIDEHVEYWD